MAQMHTLVLNGQSYTVTDPTAARIDDTKVGADAWSAKNIIDRLCPGFSAQGSFVACQPVAGYPLEVTTHIPANTEGVTGLTLRQVGKNHLKLSEKCYTQTASGATITVNGDKSVTIQTGEDGTTGLISVILFGSGVGANAAKIADYGIQQNVQYTFSVNQNLPNGVVVHIYYYDESANPIASTKIPSGESSVGVLCKTATRLYAYMNIPTGTVLTTPLILYPMIEKGEVVTPYEPYRCQEKTAAFTSPVYGGTYNWATGVLTDSDGNTRTLTPQPMWAGEGVNHLYSNVGQTQVTGKLDLVALLKKGGLTDV